MPKKLAEGDIDIAVFNETPFQAQIFVGESSETSERTLKCAPVTREPSSVWMNAYYGRLSEDFRLCVTGPLEAI